MPDFNSRPYVLAETNWKTVKETDYEVAVLPWGATEAHNYHLPYATDNFQADEIAIAAAKIAWDAGSKVVILPCVPFGVNTGQMDIKLCLNMNPSTQFAVLKDIAQVICRSGIKKLVILNGHGGNHFKQMIRELTLTYPDLFVCSVNWYEAIDATRFFDEPGNHAGALETSLMMDIAPKLVRPLSEAGSGAAKTFRIKAFVEGWASSQRRWTKVTDDTGVGNPDGATKQKGRAYLNECCQKIAQFFVDLAKADIDELYE